MRQLRAAGKQILWQAAQVPPLRGALIRGYETLDTLRYRIFGASGGGWKRKHPFDALYRVDTSGMLPSYMLTKDVTRPRADDAGFGSYVTLYAAAQPSIIRKALATIPNPHDCHFLDLGCGKGRPLLIASEYDFRHVTGVEYSPTLVRIAQRNAARFARNFPRRTAISVVQRDALVYPLPPENLVIFLYHPFGPTSMQQLLYNIEASIAEINRDLYIIYYNPVCAAVFDASPVLRRRFAAQIDYDLGELGYGLNDSDAVVVWQNVGSQHALPGGTPDAKVIPTIPGWRVEIQR